MKTIVFCIPGCTFSYKFLRCWTEILLWCKNNDIIPKLSNDINANVYYVRSQILGADTLRGKHQKPFNGTLDYDYIMFIDSDVICKPEDIKTLLDMNEDIACGAYLMDGGTHYPIVENLDNNYYLENGSFEFLSREDLNNKTNNFKAAYCGMGFMMIKKNVIEQLEYPWFFGDKIVFNEDVEEFASEDVTFCMSLIKKGFNILINPNVRVGHEKSILYIDKPGHLPYNSL